jgi:hypothetical protein
MKAATALFPFSQNISAFQLILAVCGFPQSHGVVVMVLVNYFSLEWGYSVVKQL